MPPLWVVEHAVVAVGAIRAHRVHTPMQYGDSQSFVAGVALRLLSLKLGTTNGCTQSWHVPGQVQTPSDSVRSTPENM